MRGVVEGACGGAGVRRCGRAAVRACGGAGVRACGCAGVRVCEGARGCREAERRLPCRRSASRPSRRHQGVDPPGVGRALTPLRVLAALPLPRSAERSPSRPTERSSSCRGPARLPPPSVVPRACPPPSVIRALAHPPPSSRALAFPRPSSERSPPLSSSRTLALLVIPNAHPPPRDRERSPPSSSRALALLVIPNAHPPFVIASAHPPSSCRAPTLPRDRERSPSSRHPERSIPLSSRALNPPSSSRAQRGISIFNSVPSGGSRSLAALGMTAGGRASARDDSRGEGKRAG